MSYSIKLILHNQADKDGLHKIQVQVIYNRTKQYSATDYKVKKEQFVNGEVTGHPQKGKINANLRLKVTEIEGRLISAIRDGDIGKEQLFELVKNKRPENKETFSGYIKKIIDNNNGKLSAGRLKHYQVVERKVLDYDPKFSFSKLSADWLIDFEKYLIGTGIGPATLRTNLSILKAIFNKAEKEGVAKKENFKTMAMPKLAPAIPIYLTEQEVDSFTAQLQKYADRGHLIAGYYFLLSCYTGYRISDCQTFNYAEMVQDGQITIRAAKNKTIVSIPIYNRLQAVLEFIKDTPFSLSQQKAREYVKDICKACGITKHVKFHSGRHTFAMMLTSKGFMLEEVAQLLGDTLDVARIYSRITNKQLSDKVLGRL